MAIEGKCIPRKQPDKFPVREDDSSAGPNRFEEQVEATSNSLYVGWLALKNQVVFGLRPCFLNEEPCD